WLKTRLALSLKALQKRYVTSDTAVTSDDGDANALCCALEAVFIHGIKNKHVRTEAMGRGKKGLRGPLPQPVFWALLKTVTHRDVITELEHLSFISTDVGRCRAWVRLALNDGLMECYLMSLLRESSQLSEYYQSTALLFDSEDREVLLSYLQGLTSLSFELSYKSAVLNEWTVTPLMLAGLVPSSDSLELPAPINPVAKRKQSWDSTSQSSGSDIIEVQHNSGPAAHQARNVGSTKLNASSLSLDTTGSSQLSSSLSSDSLLQVNGQKSPDKSSEEHWPSDLDVLPTESSPEFFFSLRLMTDFSENAHSSDDSGLSSQAPLPLSESTESSGSDGETHHPATPLADPPTTGPSAPVLPLTGTDIPGEQSKPRQKPVPDPHSPAAEPTVLKVFIPQTSLPEPASCPSVEEQPQGDAPKRTDSCLSRNLSVDSLHSPTTGLPKNRSWISEDDFYKPCQEETSRPEEAVCCGAALVNGDVPAVPVPEPEPEQPPPSVVHRRQTGLVNPFRGLLKLGNLERRGPVGIWKEYYCELSPYEFRLYLNDEERTCCENCSLRRCESVRSPNSDGRFELHFTGKKLFLRAPSQDEAEDWVDRLWEAITKLRPAPLDEQWEILQASDRGRPEKPTPASSPASKQPSLEESQPPVLCWIRDTDPEQDAIKETVLYHSTDGRSWTPYVFSLSLEALKVFRVQHGQKLPHCTHSIESIRDVVPDTSQGSPAFFKVLTSKCTLLLQAECEREAHSWRRLIRGALNSYLETTEDEASGTGDSSNLHRLIQHSLRAGTTLLPYLCTVPIERGMDVQKFKCAGCRIQIGFSFGKPKLCEYSRQYYCDGCHQGEVSVIPSLIIHNWDLAAREVSRPAMKFLAQIAHEPLINMERLNPGLYSHVDQMMQIYNSRQKLRLLGDYLKTCRSGAIKNMQAKLQHRHYLLESAHKYSVADLRQIAEGQYEAFLQTIIQFGSIHVYNCVLCTQRGFICQICNHDDIIFPFEFSTTTRCQECKTVFHSSCKAQSAACPRCLRLQKYLERELQD
ncbi:PKHM1 protein, partial [Amia calva]|nr:PKHM1 protein [Amia calva]